MTDPLLRNMTLEELLRHAYATRQNDPLVMALLAKLRR
jgi:hypothetical protein